MKNIATGDGALQLGLRNPGPNESSRRRLQPRQETTPSQKRRRFHTPTCARFWSRQHERHLRWSATACSQLNWTQKSVVCAEHCMDMEKREYRCGAFRALRRSIDFHATLPSVRAATSWGQHFWTSESYTLAKRRRWSARFMRWLGVSAHSL